jgi:hypothetical protein
MPIQDSDLRWEEKVRYAYDASGNVEYAGYANKGAATTGIYRIVKYIYTSGNLSETQSAQGTWDNRASLTYT